MPCTKMYCCLLRKQEEEKKIEAAYPSISEKGSCQISARMSHPAETTVKLKYFTSKKS